MQSEPGSLPATRRGEPLAGKSILLHAEQGIGDTLQFIRYVPAVAATGAIVHVEVQPCLKSLLGSFPSASSVLATGEPLPDFDFQSPLLSLPFALDTRLETIPGALPSLSAPKEHRQKWTVLLPRRAGLRVGVAWRGNPRHGNDANRSIPFELFQRVFAADGVQFVSLQIGPNDIESAALAANPQCVDPTGGIADVADTAAIVEQLDLVLTVDTFVAHFAGTLGKPVWLLLPFAPDWRWMLGRDDSPWYLTMRLFRQPGRRDWDSVIARVIGELSAAPGSIPAHREPAGPETAALAAAL